MQEDPDDDDDVAVDEDGDDQVERAVVGAHSDEAIELGGAAESAKALRTLLCTFLQSRFTLPTILPRPSYATTRLFPSFLKGSILPAFSLRLPSGQMTIPIPAVIRDHP